MGSCHLAARQLQSRTIRTENKIQVISAQKSLTCHLINCKLVTCFVAQPKVASHGRFFHPDSQRQMPGTKLVQNASLGDHGTKREIAFSLFPKAGRLQRPRHRAVCFSISPSSSHTFCSCLAEFAPPWPQGMLQYIPYGKVPKKQLYQPLGTVLILWKRTVPKGWKTWKSQFCLQYSGTQVSPS